MRCAIAAGPELLDPISCRAFLIRRLHPAGATCHHCGVAVTGKPSETFSAGGRVHCNSCGRWITYRTGTPFAGSTADDRQVALFSMLVAVGCPPSVIAASCRLSEDTVRSWRKRLCEVSPG